MASRITAINAAFLPMKFYCLGHRVFVLRRTGFFVI